MSERVEVFELDLTEVQEEAQATGQTLKELRAEVKELRTTLENTEVGTEEFGKALTDLTIKQQELTNVTKSGIAAQKGSYNDLVNQMALLKAEWRSTADEGKRAALGEQINEINTRLKEMDASVGNYQRNVGNYRQELKQLKDQLMELEEGTEEYATAMARAAEISQQMQDVNEFISQSAQDMGDHLKNVVGVAAGMVGAFQSVQASLNLIGIESKKVDQMIATMQNLMAVTQGLTAIEGAIDPMKRLGIAIKGTTLYQKLFNTSKEEETVVLNASTAAQNANTVATKSATVATNGFKKALISTGIGALIVAIGTLIAYWDDVTEAIGKYTKKADEAADINEKLIKQGEYLDRRISKRNKEREREIALMEAQGATEKDVLEARKKLLQENLDDQRSYIRDLEEQISHAEYNLENVISTSWTEEKIQALRDQLIKAKEARDGLVDEMYDVDTSIMVAAIKENQKVEKEVEKSNAKAVEAVKKAVETANVAKQTIASIPDIDIRDEEYDRERNVERIMNINAKMMDKIDDLYREYDIKMERLNREGDRVGMSETTTRLLEDEKSILESQYRELLILRTETEVGTAEYQDIVRQLDLTLDEIRYKEEQLKTAVEDETLNKLDSIKDTVGFVKESIAGLLTGEDGDIFASVFDGIVQGLDMASAAIKKQEKDWKDYGQMAAAGLGVASNILTQIAEKQDESTKEGFEKQKKMQIAAATMGMLAGVVNAVTSAFSSANAWMTIWGQAAAAASMSALVITSGMMQINQIKKQKFDGDSGGAAASVPTISALQMMDTGVQATTNIEGASAQTDVRDQRVFVVESDITNSQNNVKTTVAEATF